MSSCYHSINRRRVCRYGQRIACALVMFLACGPRLLQATPVTFTNNAGVVITDPPSTSEIPRLLKGNPYPSTITVSGFAPDASILDVNVILHNVTHQFLDDLDIMLVGPAGPTGPKVVLVSNVSAGVSVSNLTWRIDDQATILLRDSNNNGTTPTTPPGWQQIWTNPNLNATGNPPLRTYRPSDYDGLVTVNRVNPTPIQAAQDANTRMFLKNRSPELYAYYAARCGGDDLPNCLQVPADDLLYDFFDLAGTAPILGDPADYIFDLYDFLGFSNPANPLPECSALNRMMGNPPFPLDSVASCATLSVFNGINPNGDWSLYVADDFTGSGGSLGGWSLEITATPEPTSIALMVGGLAVLGVARWRRTASHARKAQEGALHILS